MTDNQRSEEQIMKKSIVVLLALLLTLMTGCALAGGAPVSGDITTGDLQTSTELCGDTVLTIDADCLDSNAQNSIKGDYTLTFRDGGHVLEFWTSSGPAVSVKKIEFDDCHLLYPANGYAKDGKIYDKSGAEASRVIIGPENYHSIEVVDGCAYKFFYPIDYTPLLYAKAGDSVFIEIDYEKYCPKGKYLLKLSGSPSELEPLINDEEIRYSAPSFKMPDAPVFIKPVYATQETGMLDMRSGKFVPKGKDDNDIIQTIDNAPYYGNAKGSFEDGYDLDKNGSVDLVFTIDDLYVPSTCSISVSFDVTVTRIARYGLLTVIFSDPSVSFSPNGGSGSMNPVKVTAGDLKYTLPECTLTPPAGKVFDKWDKGAPGTKITVTADTVIKAVWKDEPAAPGKPDSLKKQVTYKGGVYELNHSKKTATFIRPVRKTASKLTIKDTVKSKGKTYKVTEIKAKACRNMKKLTAVTIGKNIKKIGRQAFENCAKLKGINILSTKISKSGFGLKCFCKISPKAVFRVPKKVLKNYTAWIISRGKAPKTVTIKK